MCFMKGGFKFQWCLPMVAGLPSTHTHIHTHTHTLVSTNILAGMTVGQRVCLRVSHVPGSASCIESRTHRSSCIHLFSQRRGWWGSKTFTTVCVYVGVGSWRRPFLQHAPCLAFLPDSIFKASDFPTVVPHPHGHPTPTPKVYY